MSLVDRTNERIELSILQHIAEDGGNGHLVVDADSDSSFTPAHWVVIELNDIDHDADIIRLTYDETELLWRRLGLILGKESA